MVQIGNVTIGEGQPKICVAITETDQKAIIAAADILVSKSIDVIEWRMDFYQKIQEWDMVEETLHRLDMSMCGKPLLVTIRTSGEGGKCDISVEDYQELLLKIANTGYVDMIDVEAFMGITYEELKDTSVSWTETYASLVDLIQQLQKKVKVVGSYHDFDKTPSYQEMWDRLHFMETIGMDIAKMAVMPRDKRDVLKLMAVTLDASEDMRIPLVTMSMGDIGSISRIAGEAYGSSMTFGSVGQASAPGQIAVNRLEEALDLLHQCYKRR